MPQAPHPFRQLPRALSRLALRLCALAALWASGPATAAAPDDIYAPPDQIVVLDYSGSMNDRKDLAAQTAQKLFEGAAARLPSGSTGLIVFGHRQPNGRRPFNAEQQRLSCRDVEVISEPIANTPSGAAVLTSRVKSIARAQGETPLVLSIATAAAQLPRGGYINVITDLDSLVCTPLEQLCQDILHELGRYSDRNIFVRHIVAMPLTTESSDLSDCLKADPHDVRTPDDVDRETGRIIRDIEEVSTPALIRLGYAYDGSPLLVPPGTAEARVEGGARDGARRFPLGAAGSTQEFSTSPGSRRITVTLADGKSRSMNVTAARGSMVDGTVIFPSYPVRLEAVGIEGAPLGADVPVTWTINSGGRKVPLEGGSVIEPDLLAGRFHVRAEAGGLAGEADFAIDPASGARQIVRVALEPGDPLASLGGARLAVKFELVSTLFADSGANGLEVVLESASGGVRRSIPFPVPGLVPLNPGTYDAALSDGRGVMPLGRVELRSGETTSLDIRYGGEPLRLETAPSDAETTWTVSGESGEAVVKGSSLRQALPPGRYRITVERRGEKEEQTIELLLGGRERSETIRF